MTNQLYTPQEKQAGIKKALKEAGDKYAAQAAIAKAKGANAKRGRFDKAAVDRLQNESWLQR